MGMRPEKQIVFALHIKHSPVKWYLNSQEKYPSLMTQHSADMAAQHSDNFYSMEEFGGIADTVLGVSKMFIRLTLDSVNNLIQNIQVGNFY